MVIPVYLVFWPLHCILTSVSVIDFLVSITDFIIEDGFEWHEQKDFRLILGRVVQYINSRLLLASAAVLVLFFLPTCIENGNQLRAHSLLQSTREL